MRFLILLLLLASFCYGQDTLGYTQTLPSTYGNNTVIRGTIFTTGSSGGNLNKFGLLIDALDATNKNVKMALYNVSSNSPASQSIVAQIEGTCTSTGINEFNYTGDVELESNTSYYLCAIVQSSTTKYYYGSVSGYTSYSTSTTYATEFASSFTASPTGPTANRAWAFWVVYGTPTAENSSHRSNAYGKFNTWNNYLAD